MLQAGVYPGMPALDRSRRVARALPVNSEVLALSALWREIAYFLLSDADRSGRLRIVYDPERQTRTLEHRPLRTVHADWRVPALILDATAPEPLLLEAVLKQSVVIKASVSARWSLHGRTRQIIRAPVSATKLGIVGRKSDGAGKRAVEDLRRLILVRAALAYPHIVAVVGQKALIPKLTTLGLPANVEVGHFGALSGLDRWKSAAG